MKYNFSVLTNANDRRRLLDRKQNQWSPLNSIIGNDNAVDALTDLCYEGYSNNQHEVKAKVMLVGPASCGKTTIANAVADVLGIVKVIVDSTQLKSNDQLAELILSEWAKQQSVLNATNYDNVSVYELPSTLIFVDEVHALCESVQEGLLKATEANDGMLFGKKYVLNCRSVFWIGATTKPGKLEKAFKTRWRRISIEPPNAEQVAQIVQLKTKWDMGLCRKVVFYSGNVPREALSFADGVRMCASRKGSTVESVLLECAKREGIDEFGMRVQRLNILKALKGGELLLRQLAFAVQLDAEELVNDWIPPMMVAGLVQHDNKYYITPAGLTELRKRGL
jgi:Holliday junction resolvasome RuvABC ATP-dependent DNA helicase subunit